MRLSKDSTDDATRHRILEGALARLARSPHTNRFILRGGMLMRLWFRPYDRPASDIDLVSTSVFDIAAAEKQLTEALFTDAFDDGLAFNHHRYRVQGIWLNTEFPGVRMIAFGMTNGVEHPMSIDVTYGESLVPAPRIDEYPLANGRNVRFKMCRPEAILARKLHALYAMGMRHWRPKDLNDVRLLLISKPVSLEDMLDGLVYSFRSRGDHEKGIDQLFAPDSWWTTKAASARWRDFVARSNGTVPRELSDAIHIVSKRLSPVLERLA
ncbi:MAG: nucleotidyl transferase AbiEii/AbiGii toxin family protein [Planctomycetota bacterium]